MLPTPRAEVPADLGDVLLERGERNRITTGCAASPVRKPSDRRSPATKKLGRVC
jgi:hypothetical protein